MCKCITKIEKQQIGQVSVNTGRKVVEFEFTEDSVGNFFNMSSGKDLGPRTKSTVRFKVDGRKKVYRTYMRHNFCPFCGKPYK